MGLYQESGYVDVEWIRSQHLAWNFVVGGRGTGKTFTALSDNIKTGRKFMLMRRTQSQTDMINTPEFSPFKKINVHFGWNFMPAPITKYHAGIYTTEIVNDKIRPVGEPVGYTCALSTISNIRGFDGHDIEELLFDEFIPESHERPIRNEGAAFLNAYETINRNRELEGQEPLRALCLANANDLKNPIFMEMGLVEIAARMCKKHQEIYINREKSVGIFMLQDSPISKKKASTSLYKASSEDSKFQKMALSNIFDYSEAAIESRNLNEFIPVVAIGEVCIYKHKSRYEYYVTTHRRGKFEVYEDSEIEIRRLRRDYRHIIQAYLDAHMVFEKVLHELLFQKYFID